MNKKSVETPKEEQKKDVEIKETPKVEAVEVKQDVVADKTRSADNILKDIADAKDKFDKAKSELAHLDKVEFGDEFNSYYDRTVVPDEIKREYPDSVFRCVRIVEYTDRGEVSSWNRINKHKKLGWEIVKIPESCSELHSQMKLNQARGLTNTFGSDVLINDRGDMIFMHMHKDKHARLKKWIQSQVNAKSGDATKSHLNNISKGLRGVDISDIGNPADLSGIDMSNIKEAELGIRRDKI